MPERAEYNSKKEKNLRRRNDSLIYKLIYVPGVVLILLVCFVVFNSLYSISAMRTQILESNENMLEVLEKTIDENLKHITDGMVNILINNYYFYELDTLPDELTESEKVVRYDGMRRLQSELGLLAEYNPYLVNITAYSENSGDSVGIYLADQTEAARLAREIAEGNESGYYRRTWRPMVINGTQYIVILRSEGTRHVIAMVRTDALLEMADSDGLNLLKGIFVSDNEGHILASLSYKHDFDPEKGTDGSLITHEIGSENLKISVELDTGSFFSGIGVFQIILFFLALLSFLVLPFLVRLVKKQVVKPISRMEEVIRVFEKGNMDVRITDKADTAEVQVLYDSFNHMAEQIRELKITVYEEKIQKQHTELQYLKMQIKPHFLMNTLNVIYSFLLTEDVASARELLVYLTNYCRSILRSDAEMLSLEEELGNLENYLRIMEMRYSRKFSYIIECEEGLEQTSVLPLMLQTLVENCIKHGGKSFNFEILIHIQTVLRENQKKVQIAIIDTGDGFEEDILGILENGQRLEGNHLGIQNIRERLRLTYKGRAEMHFFNRPEGGAEIRIEFPFGG